MTMTFSVAVRFTREVIWGEHVAETEDEVISLAVSWRDGGWGVA